MKRKAPTTQSQAWKPDPVFGGGVSSISRTPSKRWAFFRAVSGFQGVVVGRLCCGVVDI